MYSLNCKFQESRDQLSLLTSLLHCTYDKRVDVCVSTRGIGAGSEHTVNTGAEESHLLSQEIRKGPPGGQEVWMRLEE